jgi:hypothetical protein
MFRFFEADLPLIAKNNMAKVLAQIGRAKDCQGSMSASKAPRSTGDVDAINIARGDQARDRRGWKRRQISVLQKYRVTGLRYPMVLDVENRTAVLPRCDTENNNPKAPLRSPVAVPSVLAPTAGVLRKLVKTAPPTSLQTPEFHFKHRLPLRFEPGSRSNVRQMVPGNILQIYAPTLQFIPIDRVRN